MRISNGLWNSFLDKICAKSNSSAIKKQTRMEELSKTKTKSKDRGVR